MKKKSPLLFTTLINKFEGNCDTFGEGGKKSCVIDDIGSVCVELFFSKQ
jgi:hypothetical protein